MIFLVKKKARTKEGILQDQGVKGYGVSTGETRVTYHKRIIEEAQRTNAVIVVGKLKGIRQRLKAGRRIRRLIGNFPYYRLVQYIKYKAEWLGIKVVEISEAYTSQTCHNCYARNKAARITQGLYQCSNCQISFNADYNGSMNIMHRALGILSSVGVL
jgi:putative transposase